jgi:hypothetical protein
LLTAYENFNAGPAAAQPFGEALKRKRRDRYSVIN